MDNLIKSFKSLKWYEWIMIVVMIVIAGWSMINAFINPESSSLPAWLTVVNFISAICGIICIFFCAKASISNYAFGIVNTVVYSIYLWYKGIYGNLGLELVVYLPVNIFGWYMWAKHRDKVEKEKTKAKKLTWKGNIIAAVAVLVLSMVLNVILNIVDGTKSMFNGINIVAILDGFVVGMGVVATYLQFFRYREQYIWWLIQDVIAVGMFIVAFDPVYLTKKSIYLIMAVIGLRNWIRLQKERNTENE